MGLSAARGMVCRRTWGVGLVTVLFAFLTATACWADGFNLGQASNFAVLFEAGGSNSLQVSNVNLYGGVGVGSSGLMTASGTSIFNAAGSSVPGSGTIYFSSANSGQFSYNSADQFSGPDFSSTLVSSALSTVNSLNSALGAFSGTDIAINGNTTINVASGNHVSASDPNCPDCYVFTVTSFSTTSSNTITINGTASQYVVINFTSSVNFDNQVVLTGGITQDQVIWNFVGGSNLSGGPSLQINTNASSYPNMAAKGIFLDPNGPISVTNANIDGRVFGGDSQDIQYLSSTNVGEQPCEVPEPATIFLLGVGLLGVSAAARRRFRPTH